jgi:c-di-GMP-binding flagellar brake protein YcgR
MYLQISSSKSNGGNWMSFNSNKGQLSDTGLIGCNMVIEGNKIVHTGTISLVEGDSIEIELPQYKQFKLGDDVKAIIYSPQGMINFNTSVIAKDAGTIVLIIPTNLHNILNKRKDHRVEIALPGRVYSIIDVSLKETNNLIQPESITIINVSLGGIGFILNSLKIRNKSVLLLEMSFDPPLLTTFEVIHVNEVEQGQYYGCRFIDLPQEHSISLRAFILKTQINARFAEKNRELEQSI